MPIRLHRYGREVEAAVHEKDAFRMVGPDDGRDFAVITARLRLSAGRIGK